MAELAGLKPCLTGPSIQNPSPSQFTLLMVALTPWGTVNGVPFSSAFLPARL